MSEPVEIGSTDTCREPASPPRAAPMPSQSRMPSPEPSPMPSPSRSRDDRRNASRADVDAHVDADVAADASPSSAAPPPAVRTRRTPKWTVINYWVDLSLLTIFLALAFVSGVTQFVFPNGPIAFDYRLWGAGFGAWRDLQFNLIALLALGVLLHLMLHWNWLCSVTNTHLLDRPPGRDDGARTLLGVGLIVAILHVLGIGLLWAQWSLTPP